MRFLNYQDTITFIIASSDGYRAGRTVSKQVDVHAIFLQSTGFVSANFQENYDSDAICYPDPEDAFIKENFDRLEGMYVKANLFGSSDAQSWYKIVTVRVNRDHLLTNVIDNVECLLTKASPLQGVS